MAHARNATASAGDRLASRSSSTGFTLIELAIVSICLAILAVTAVTSYEFATIKARRANAQSCLIEAATYLERYYTTEMTYVGSKFPDCSSDVTDFYDVGFTAAPTAGAYTVQAKPKGRQAEKEKDCGTMTIDQVGRKTPVDGCW